MARRADKKAQAPAALVLSAQATQGQAADALQAHAAVTAVIAALFALTLPLLLTGCMTLGALASALMVAVLVAALLGIASATPAASSRASFVALVAVVAALACMLVIPVCRTGLFSLFNALVSYFDDAFGAYVPLIANGGAVASSVAFGLCLGVLWGAISWMLARLRRPGVILVVLVVLGACALKLGCGAGLAGLTAGIAACLCMFRQVQTRHSVGIASRSVADLAPVVLACVLVSVVCGLVYTPQSGITNLQNSAQQQLQSLRYGGDTLPQGSLARSVTMNADDGQERLSLTVGGRITDDLLLRGFVGGDYAQGEWTALNHTAYEGDWTGMFSWLEDEGFSPAQQRASYDSAAAKAGQGRTGTATITINATGADRQYLYVPYTLRTLNDGDLAQSQDGAALNALGTSSYRMRVDNVTSDNVLADASWMSGTKSEFAQAEGVYSAFVKEHYLAISEEDAAAVNAAIYDPETWDAEAGDSTQAVVSRVRTMLNTLASYTDSPQAVPDGVNFADWFLNQSRQGNSAYFATVATLAFRAQGIPARYVEGYRASAESLAGSAQRTVSLTSADAHAWTEIYIDGAGWTPIEVTPGFYTQQLVADQVIDVAEEQNEGESDATVPGVSVAGNVVDNPVQLPQVQPLQIALDILAVLVVLLVLALLIGIGQRLVRISKREKLYTHKKQTVAVPALYRYLALLMAASGIGFDASRPLECSDQLAAVYPDIDVREYQRVIQLHQRFAFGGRKMQPNELRTLQNFNERIHEMLPKPTGFVAALRRFFVDAL